MLSKFYKFYGIAEFVAKLLKEEAARELRSPVGPASGHVCSSKTLTKFNPSGNHAFNR